MTIKKKRPLPISRFVWFDGRYVTMEKATIPVTTHAIHYGTSIFEGIRAYWDKENLYVFRLDDHVRRFRRSGQFYSIALNFSDDQIKKAITGICKKNKIKESCYIRPFYFVGQYGINLHVTEEAPTHVAIFTFPFGELFNKEGITACVTSWRKFSDNSTPPLAKMGGNYLNSILATQEAKRNGYDEAILLDHNSNVSEAPGENIFLVRDEEIITPPLSSSALEGITRETVIKITRDELDLKTSVREVTRGELYLADEIFLTGTAAEITPIKKIDHKLLGDGRRGPITNEIMDAYQKIVTNKMEKYSDWLTPVY